MADVNVGSGAIPAAGTLTGAEIIGILQSANARELTVDRFPFWNGTEYMLSQASPVLRFNSGGPYIKVPSSNRIYIGNDGTTKERVAISSSGIIHVGGARAGGGVQDYPGSGNMRVVADTAGGMAISTYDTQDYNALQFVRDVAGSAAQNGSVRVNVSSVTYNTTSDYRLKNIDGPAKGALARFMRLRFYDGEYKADPGAKVIFQLAHEAKEIVPYAVTGEKDATEDIGTAVLPNRDADGRIIIGDQVKIIDIPEHEAPEGSVWSKSGTRPIFQEMDYSKEIPLFGAALQELHALVEAQAEKLAALEKALAEK